MERKISPHHLSPIETATRSLELKMSDCDKNLTNKIDSSGF